LNEFKAFVTTLESSDVLKLEDEWRLYADNLILAIARQLLHTNYCIDFQLLIRICYLIRLCLETNASAYRVLDSVTADLINGILNLPILLLPRLLITRCAEDCSQRNKTDLPKGSPATAAASGK